MLFSSLAYLLFFPPVLLAFWLLPHRFRGALLLVASYYFYMSWIPVYGILLFLLTLINYFLGFRIFKSIESGKSASATDKEKGPKAARRWLTLGVVINLATLSYFKYTDFLIDSWNVLVQASAPWLHISAKAMSFPLQHVVLPLGISFFVFEFIHYIVDGLQRLQAHQQLHQFFSLCRFLSLPDSRTNQAFFRISSNKLKRLAHFPPSILSVVSAFCSRGCLKKSH